MRDYSSQILTGEGSNDYARYMRTDALLSLQRRSDEMVHRDELLFQIVHQSTELWLKLACTEIWEAANRIRQHQLEVAIQLLARASECMGFVTDQLEMMRHLSPWDFQTIRTVLGHGSGADSPGWLWVRRYSRRLDMVFTELLDGRGIDLVDLYRDRAGSTEQRLAEALVEWDERVSLWRVRHYKIATRVIGNGVVGTQGTPVDTLARLIEHKFFPALWQVRSSLSAVGPMSDLPVGRT